MRYDEKEETFTGEIPIEERSEAVQSIFKAKVIGDDSLFLPPELSRSLGLSPDVTIDIIAERDGIVVRPNIHSLAKVYIEPTSVCNLECQTCIRNTWAEPLGTMEAATFNKLLEQLAKFPRLQSVMFGGYGEPTAHREILSMIQSVKSLNVEAELVTNGTLLDDKTIRGLFASRLDTLWISFDGADIEHFEEIRKGASFRQVVESLGLFRRLNKESAHKISLGIAFVVMKKNLGDLANIDRLIWETGARKASVSNVIPYTEEMEKEMVCGQTLSLDTLTYMPERPDISLPRLDVASVGEDVFLSLLKGYHNLSIMGRKISAETRQCRFISDRSTFIRWDGKVAPCMGLAHSHTTYLNGLKRTIESHVLGDICSDDLFAVWNSREYGAFREKVRLFEFSPCHHCGGCDYLESNKEDCFGNTFPACGACLWAQGIIQCP